MKKITGIIPIPAENIKNLVISLIVLAVFLGAAILPSYVTKVQIDNKIQEAGYRLNEHKSLLPLYQTLKHAPGGDSAGLTMPVGIRLEKAGLDSALRTLRGLAGKSNMTVVDVRPELDYASKDMQTVAVTVFLKGNFENFRAVLMDLTALPYVDRVEDLSIQRKSNALTLDFKIKIILAMR